MRIEALSNRMDRIENMVSKTWPLFESRISNRVYRLRKSVDGLKGCQEMTDDLKDMEGVIDHFASDVSTLKTFLRKKGVVPSGMFYPESRNPSHVYNYDQDKVGERQNARRKKAKRLGKASPKGQEAKGSPPSSSEPPPDESPRPGPAPGAKSS